jgi:signal transduction histidine kinase
MRRLLVMMVRQDRAGLIRHAALCLAAAVALIWPRATRIGDEAVWLLTLLVLINFSASVIFRRVGGTSAFPTISTALGLAGWSALACVTGGITSPFVAGLWLEVLLSALSFRCAGTICVTAGSLAALSVGWWVAGPEESVGTLLLQAAFLAAMGGVTALVTCRWQGAQDDLAQTGEDLSSRLACLERDLEVAHRMGKLGENAARLAHGIKNSVHALRGYTSLIQERGDHSTHSRALEGIRSCLNHLEEVSRLTLRPVGGPSDGSPEEGATDADRIIEEVIQEVSVAFPGVTWRFPGAPSSTPLAAPPAVVHEALLNLIRNAAEAMRGRGEVEIETCFRGGTFEISVRDRGVGLEEPDLERIFTPGRSTKAQGSGFGLFVTRQVLESYGGFLRASSTRGEGSLFAMGLPLRRV